VLSGEDKLKLFKTQNIILMILSKLLDEKFDERSLGVFEILSVGELC